MKLNVCTDISVMSQIDEMNVEPPLNTPMNGAFNFEYLASQSEIQLNSYRSFMSQATVVSNNKLNEQFKNLFRINHNFKRRLKNK